MLAVVPSTRKDIGRGSIGKQAALYQVPSRLPLGYEASHFLGSQEHSSGLATYSPPPRRSPALAWVGWCSSPIAPSSVDSP